MARLGQLERRVMDVLWASMGTGHTVRQVAEELPDHAYTTVLTVLDRLRQKELVHRTKVGRAHCYEAVATREAYVAEQMREAMGTGPDRLASLVRFAQTVSPDQAVALRRALAEQDGGRRRPAPRPA